jgi:hypothetical protein
VALLATLGQVLMALGFSGAIAYWIGALAYVVATVVVFLVCAIILTESARREIAAQAVFDIHDSRSPGLIGLTVIISAIVFAVIWPSLAPILAWSSWRRRRQAPSP